MRSRTMSRAASWSRPARRRTRPRWRTQPSRSRNWPAESAPHGLEPEAERNPERHRGAALLPLRGELGAQGRPPAAAGHAQRARPAVGARVRGQRERVAAVEMGDRVAERPAEDLAAAALDLGANPGPLRLGAAEIEARGEREGASQLVAVAILHPPVE